MTFHIYPGVQTVLGTVAVTGSEIVDNWREAGKPPLKGSPFTSTLLQPYLDAITGEALLDGYPDAVIHPALTAHGDTVDVTLDIEPGAQAVIDSLVLTGLTRTRGDVIRRELYRLLGALVRTGHR